MFKLVAVVALVATAASAGTLPKPMFNRSPFGARLNGKIINGEETTIEKNPHQISIRSSDRHRCGGSIISKYWVLTAAHCLTRSLDSYTILAGTADKFDEKSGSVHTVNKIISHPHYADKDGTLINDVGLIHVLKPFEFDETRQPIELFNKDEESPAGAVSVVTGWGTTEAGSTQILHRVEIPIISKATCSKQYSYAGGIPEGEICAGYEEGGKDTCRGDSGGPLTIEGRLAGIVSWGRGCAQPGYAGVYTEVAYFRDWIQSVASI